MSAATPLDELAFGVTLGSEVASFGDYGARLLAGPAATDGPEPLDAHVGRLGALPLWQGDGALRAMLRESGLQGRGGGGFPMARKVETAWLAPGEPLVVVNASESEPASRKDRVLCTYRPHLVLDGAAAAAAMVGSSEVVVHLHRSSAGVRIAVGRAMAERRDTGEAVEWRMSLGPDRYVAGESTAIASLLDGGEARPAFSATKLAERGPSGRPTLLNNAETMAHLGLLVRWGAIPWAAGGPPSTPGSQLLTLTGAVPRPGDVVEVIGRATVGEVLARSGEAAPPAAVLVGGYAGTWIAGDVAWQTPFERNALECVGAVPGCGLVGVLPHGACGLVETARLVGYLADENAGQCGPCVTGLPAVAELLGDLARGSLRRSGLRRLVALCGTVSRGGACGHPDAVVHLVRSALEVFEDDVVRHLAGRACQRVAPPAGLRRAGRGAWTAGVDVSVVVRIDPTRCRGHAICRALLLRGHRARRMGVRPDRRRHACPAPKHQAGAPGRSGLPERRDRGPRT